MQEDKSKNKEGEGGQVREIITKDSEDKLKKWDGKDLKMIDGIEKWCNDNDMRDMFNSYRAVTEFPTLFKPMKEYQEIDWHEIDISEEIDRKMKEEGEKQEEGQNDENIIKVEAERGFYDIETKKFVFGIRICTGEWEEYENHQAFTRIERRYISKEEKQKRQDDKDKRERQRINARLMLIGHFDENRQLFGYGRKMRNTHQCYEGIFENSKLKMGQLAYKIHMKHSHENHIKTFVVQEEKIDFEVWHRFIDDQKLYSWYRTVINNKLIHLEYRNNQIWNFYEDHDNTIEEKFHAKKEEQVFQKLELEENKLIKDWLDSGQDVRTYLKMDFDPIHYFFEEEQLKKYTLVRAEEKLRRYTIKDDHDKEFEMLTFYSIDEKEIKQNERKETELERFEMCLLEHQETGNLRDIFITHGKLRNTNWTRKDLLYIITKKPLTLIDYYENPKREEFTTQEILTISRNIVCRAKEYQNDRNMLLTSITPYNIHYDEEFKGFVRITEMVKNVNELTERCDFKWRQRQDFAYNLDTVKKREGIRYDKHFYSQYNLARQEGSKISVFEQIFYILQMIMNKGNKYFHRIKDERNDVYPLDCYNDFNYTEYIHELWKQIMKEDGFTFHEIEKQYRQFQFKYWEIPREIEKKDNDKMELVKFEKFDDVIDLMKKRPNLKRLVNKGNQEDFGMTSGAYKSQIYDSNSNIQYDQFSNLKLEKQIPQNEFKIDDEQMLMHHVNHQKILDKYQKEYPDKTILEIFRQLMDKELKECFIQESLKFFNKIQTEKRVKNQIYSQNEKDKEIEKEIQRVVSDLSSVRGGYLKLYNYPPQKDKRGKDIRCKHCYRPIKEKQAWSPGQCKTKDNDYLLNYFCTNCYPVNNDDKLDYLIQLQQDQYVEKKYPYFDANDNIRLNSILESRGNLFSYKGSYCQYEPVILPPYLMKKNEKRWDIRDDYVIGRKIEWLNIISQPNVKFWMNYKNIAVDLEDEKHAIIYYFDLQTRDVVTMIVNKDEFNPHKDKIRSSRPFITYDRDQKTFKFGYKDNKQINQIINPLHSSLLEKFKIFPTSDVYISNDNVGKTYLQIFTIAFSVEQFQEMFDMELKWKDQDNPLSIDIINMKHVYSFGDPGIYSDITPETGSIDGFCLNDEARTFSYKRSRPSSFGMSNNISFNKYTTYKYGDRKLITESQLTTPMIQRLNNYERMSILFSNLRTIVNMVPGFINLAGFFDMNDKNWLQPREIFGGRSISQLKIGYMFPQSHFDRDTLYHNWSYTIGDQYISELQEELVKKLRIERTEMSYDLTYQTVLHNCLDFKSLASVQDYRQSIIVYALDYIFENPLNHQILVGIFGLQLEQEIQLNEMELFLNDVGEDQLQILWPEIKRDESKDKNLPLTSDRDYQLLQVSNQDLNLTKDQSRDVIVEEVVEQLVDGGDIRINHFYSKWTEIFFQSKFKKYILEHDQSIDRKVERNKDRQVNFPFFEQKSGFNSQFDIALLTFKLNEKYGEHIENQKVMKSFIDAQFVITYKIIIFMFCVYIVAFVVPFLLQIFATTPLQIIMLNSCCMLVQIPLFIIELIQLKFHGVKNYINDAWNMIDMTHFIVYTIFYLFRIQNTSMACLPTQKQQPNDVSNKQTFMVFITSAMLFLLTIKIMFFMKVSEYFGNLVKLVITVLSQIGPFTVFFVMWLITNSLLYKVSGIDPVQTDDYPNIHYGVALLITVFRNTIGDISLPTYKLWFDQQKDHQDLLPIVKPNQKAIVYFGWLLFFFNEFFNLIVLLNFLIAIIGQSYDEVQSREEINRYNSKCDLNLEIAILLDTFNLSKDEGGDGDEDCDEDHNKTIFSLMANTYHKDDVNEFQGFVKTIKQALKRENKILKEDLRGVIKNQMSQQIQRVEDRINGIRNQCNNLQNDNKANKETFREMEEKILFIKQEQINQKDAAKVESKRTNEMFEMIKELRSITKEIQQKLFDE